MDSRLQANETKLLTFTDDSSAAIEQLAAQLVVEAESLRAESNWGLALQAETSSEEITRSVETLRADLAENATQFQNRVTETLQAVRPDLPLPTSELRCIGSLQCSRIDLMTGAG